MEQAFTKLRGMNMQRSLIYFGFLAIFLFFAVRYPG